jgi:hypothetical protein
MSSLRQLLSCGSAASQWLRTRLRTATGFDRISAECEGSVCGDIRGLRGTYWAADTGSAKDCCTTASTSTAAGAAAADVWPGGAVISAGAAASSTSTDTSTTDERA